MTDLSRVLAAFYDATHCDAGVWMRTSPDQSLPPTLFAGTARLPVPRELPDGPGENLVASDRGDLLVATVPGPRPVWLALGPATADIDLRKHMGFLLPVVTQYLH